MNTLADLLNQLSPSWWEYTLHATWQAALTTAILLGLAALGRKWPAPWRGRRVNPHWLRRPVLCKPVPLPADRTRRRRRRRE